jgi:bifunctional non-homologous end joining protein LigD
VSVGSQREWHKDRREGLARLDDTQNAHQQDARRSVSARPAAGAPVSVPIRWEELEDPDLQPDGWTVRTVIDRVQAVGDPLAPLVGRQQQLPAL